MDPIFTRWLKSLPTSKMVYPDAYTDRLKYVLWLFLGLIHPYVRDVLMMMSRYERRYEKFRPNGRQQYMLGMLAPRVTPRALTEYLVSQGYGKHFIALEDKGELVSLRYTPNFEYQYHIRIFKDGEVRAHYEYTVECHPFLHDREIGFEPRREVFLTLLEGYITPAPKTD